MKFFILSLFIIFFTFLSGVNWEVQLIIENNSANDSRNYFGKHSGSSDEHDGADILEFFISPNPPFVSLYFPHPEWDNWAADYTRDIRSDSLQNEIWNFEISAGPYYNQEYQLSWLNIESIPDCYDIELNLNLNVINMKETDSFSFSSSSSIMTGYIELTVNNFPPTITAQIPPIYILQNQINITNNLNQYFSDVDNDPLTFSSNGSEHLEISFPMPPIILISPAQSWFGSETITLRAEDSNGASIDMNIDVIVQPAQPAIVTNIQMTVNPQTISLQWDSVNTDINDMPLNNIVYNIYESNDSNFIISSENFKMQTGDTFVTFPNMGTSSGFYKITAVNGLNRIFETESLRSFHLK